MLIDFQKKNYGSSILIRTPRLILTKIISEVNQKSLHFLKSAYYGALFALFWCLRGRFLNLQLIIERKIFLHIKINKYLKTKEFFDPPHSDLIQIVYHILQELRTPLYSNHPTIQDLRVVWSFFESSKRFCDFIQIKHNEENLAIFARQISLRIHRNSCLIFYRIFVHNLYFRWLFK